MKIGVLGSGLMGTEAARDLVNSRDVQVVGLADVDSGKLKRAEQTIDSKKLVTDKVDASDPDELGKFMKRFDVVVNALFYSFNEMVAGAGIDVGTHVVDLGGHIGGMTDRVLSLDDRARSKGVTIIPDLGVAPGMINILTGYGASKLDQLKEIKLYVGGIPVRPEPPLGYNHVFSMEGVFDHYTDPSLIIRDGEQKLIPSLSEVEEIYFEKFGPLEAFHTSGGTSTLTQSYSDVQTLEYKTIRYPGHAEKFKLLVDLNLTKKDIEVEVEGKKVNPRKVVLQAIDPIVDLRDKEDAVLLRVAVTGMKKGEPQTYQYEMQTFKDTSRNITAMARVTASTISIVAQLIAAGTIAKRGVYPPERAVPGEVYIAALKERGIEIKEMLL
ncbi:saccharopine dehydrogenase family protein [Oceanobacillus indicireducens]|uniref:Saccharopine dehydrogenase n=1 Tax=Oceanobacillus indicireducens TaxID=1004261 RepID=A0A917XUA8_9BACI|nr:saccharopine dehydrogenase C-terminal domain-containing protein [Oceanobacillus indicireducens]GGN54033.1 saccharopine dehydrogenase [Oceanobacillus indicireducens]